MKLKYFLFCLFFLGSCGNNYDENKFNESVTTSVEKKGNISKKELSFFEDGTHFLKTKNEGDFLLKSSTVDLSQFEDRLVQVNGNLTSNSESSIIDVISVDFTENDVNSLVKYEEKDFFINFEISKIWKKNKDEGVLTLNNDNSKITISVLDEKKIKDNDLSDTIKKGIKAKIVDKVVKKYVKNDKNISIYVLYNKDKIISFDFKSKDYSFKDKEDFYNFIESVNFINNDYKINETREISGNCGGIARKRCTNGYRCEIDSESKDNSGVCVKNTNGNYNFIESLFLR